MLCKNMQLILARFPKCKPRCISSNINENMFSRVRRKQRQFTVQEFAQWHANLLLVNEQREAGRDRSGYSVGPTRGVNHSASLNLDNQSGQALDLLVRKSPAQNAAAADLRGADEKKEEDLKLKAMLAPLQIRVRHHTIRDGFYTEAYGYASSFLPKIEDGDNGFQCPCKLADGSDCTDKFFNKLAGLPMKNHVMGRTHMCSEEQYKDWLARAKKDRDAKIEFVASRGVLPGDVVLPTVSRPSRIRSVSPWSSSDISAMP